MSAKHMGQVFDLALSHSQAWVLLAMADHADHFGERIYPGLARVAWKTGFSQRQVRRIVGQLVALGVMELVQVATGRPGIANHYRLTLERGAMKPAYRTGPEEAPETEDTMSSLPDETEDIGNQREDKSDQREDIAMSSESPLRTPIENRPETRALESPLRGGDPIAERGQAAPPPKPAPWDRLLALLGEAGLAPWDRSPQAQATWGDLLRGRKVGDVRTAIRSARKRMPTTMGTCTPEDLRASLAEPVGA